MRTFARVITTVLTLLLLNLSFARAQAMGQERVGRKLIIGTRHVPPFAIHTEDGSWKGISIDLWREIASELDLTYELRETDLKGMVGGLQDGTYDAAVAALTMTAEREELIDFTHPFYNSGLGIAVPATSSSGWAGLLARFASADLAKVIAGLAVLLFVERPGGSARTARGHTSRFDE